MQRNSIIKKCRFLQNSRFTINVFNILLFAKNIINNKKTSYLFN